jgi:hypothetical protein
LKENINMGDMHIPAEPGVVPDEELGIPGPSEDMPEDDSSQDDAEDLDYENYSDDDDPDELDGEAMTGPVEDGLEEPEDDS